MENKQQANLGYIFGVSGMTFVVPVVAGAVEHFINDSAVTFYLVGKWFIFFGVGVRLFLAGIRQTTKPAFTAREIFHIDNPESFPIVRELGFANLCFGLVGLVSLFVPDWRIVSAFASGIYYGAAGLQHAIKKPAGVNEQFALWSDLVIFALLAMYFFRAI